MTVAYELREFDGHRAAAARQTGSSQSGRRGEGGDEDLTLLMLLPAFCDWLGLAGIRQDDNGAVFTKL